MEFNGYIGNWDLSDITDITSMFKNCTSFNTEAEKERIRLEKIKLNRNIFLEELINDDYTKSIPPLS
jgi:hypothetical protein